jgi:hypothetical protein
MIDRYDRGAQTLSDLQYEPFPDISRALPELVEIVDRLHTRLHTRAGEAKRAIAESPMIPPAFLVGAIGFEPTTPTVSR